MGFYIIFTILQKNRWNAHFGQDFCPCKEHRLAKIMGKLHCWHFEHHFEVVRSSPLFSSLRWLFFAAHLLYIGHGKKHIWYHIAYCTIWYHIVQYGIILYNMVPYCTIWYHIVQYGIILYNMVSYYIACCKQSIDILENASSEICCRLVSNQQNHAKNLNT